MAIGIRDGGCGGGWEENISWRARFSPPVRGCHDSLGHAG